MGASLFSTLIKSYWKQVTALVVLLLSVLGFSQWRYNAGYEAADQAWKLKWINRDVADATANLKRSEQERAEEQRRVVAVEEEQKHAQMEIAKARVAADIADRAGAGLRKQLENLQRQLAGSETGRLSATVSASSARTKASILLAQLLSESDKAAGEYAKEADRNYVAGKLCENIYDRIRDKSD